MWQLIQELCKILEIFLAFVAHGLLDLYKQLKWQSIILIDSVESHQFFLILSIRLIIVLNERSQRTICKRESHDTNHHTYNTKGHLKLVSSSNITISDSSYSLESPVHRDGVKLVRFIGWEGGYPGIIIIHVDLIFNDVF